jgi:glyoxylate/hydroxypyruvate reductase
MKQSIYIYSAFGPAQKGLLLQELNEKYNVIFHEEVLENMQFDVFANCDYCLGNIPLQWCLLPKKLKWLQLHSAGIDPYNQLTSPDFLITNLRGFFAESVAETTLAGILAFYRGIDRLANYKTDNQWVGSALRPSLHKLHRKKIWVLGGGSIANKFIELIAPFDCQITQTKLSELKLNAHSDDFFAKNAHLVDILVLILPEIPESIHYLNKERLSRLNANTLIVNTGRGSSIAEEDLKQILVEGKLMGAVLDVNEVEPIPSENTIWKLPNVILTQHTAGGWIEEKKEITQLFIKQLSKIERGEPLDNYVDCERGY